MTGLAALLKHGGIESWVSAFMALRSPEVELLCTRAKHGAVNLSTSTDVMGCRVQASTTLLLGCLWPVDYLAFRKQNGSLSAFRSKTTVLTGILTYRLSIFKMKMISLLAFPPFPPPRKSTWRERGTTRFSYPLSLGPFPDCPPALFHCGLLGWLLRGLKFKGGGSGMSGNNPPVLAEWWITPRQSILALLFFQTGFYWIKCFILTQ